MKLSLGRIVEILANLGVIAGLVFLGLEIQQNNELLETEIIATRQAIRAQDFLLPVEYPELGQALIDSRNGMELTEYQILILDRVISTTLFNWQFIHAEFVKGRIDEEDLPIRVWRQAFRGGSTSENDYWPEMTEFWQRNHIAFNPAFVAWMEENIVNP
jgi:hypothetical protein